MRILLYSSKTEPAEKLVTSIPQEKNDIDVTVCNNFEELDQTLRNIYSFSALVLFVANKEELLELITLKRILIESTLILVLHETSKELVRFALKLYPRYMTETGESPQVIPDVLLKILSAKKEHRKAYYVDEFVGPRA